MSVDANDNRQCEHLLLNYSIGVLEAFGLFPTKWESSNNNTIIIIQLDDTIESKFLLAGPKKMLKDFLQCLSEVFLKHSAKLKGKETTFPVVGLNLLQIAEEIIMP